MKRKGFFAVLLSLCMVLSMIPMSANAQEFERSIILGMGNISVGDMVYLGQYDGSPILWRVLNPTTTNAGANGTFLISEYLLGNTSFGTNTTWAGGTAQLWCTNLISNTSNFSTTESDVILPTTKADGPYFPYGASALSGEKAFFLSAEEAITYFFNNNARTARLISGSAGHWWLRSPSDVDNAGIVNDSGALASGWVLLPLSARPALNINRYSPSILFRSAATGGKSNGAEGALNPVSNSATGFPAWKLTLLDSTRSGFSIATTAVSGTSVTISYSGATTGTNEYISAAFTDFFSGAVTYYGRLKHIPDASDASGSMTFGIPAGVLPGTNGTLVVFNEQYSGGASDSTYLTDYASPMRIVSNTVNAYALTVVNGTDSTGGSPYAAGTQVSISADAAPAGQQFKEWVSNNGGTFDNAGSASTTFTMPAAAVTVTATYENIPLPGDAPALTQQPQNTSVSAGNAAVFTVAATGTSPLTYQWQMDRSDGNGWQDIGANNASYTTPTTQLSDSGYQYRCKVSNSVGEAISDPAVLTVTATWQPAFAVTGGTAGTDYTYGTDGVLVFTQNGTYAISMTTPGTTTATDRVVVQSGVTADISLSDVSIDVSAAGSCAFEMYGADVNLALEGQNILQSGSDYAGIHCPEYATLTIGGTGTLNAVGGENGAGVGGNNGERGGAIQINGGTLTATGGIGGAGLGGGKSGRGGTVTIDGGMVTTQGGTDGMGIGGAGIGGGALGSGGAIEINGGTVAATGGQYGAGIGGGDHKPSGGITISGGTVTAESESGAGIGGGIGSNGGHIAITGGTVIATSGTGAGLGGGDGGDGGAVTISGGSVIATGTGAGQNIGYGAGGSYSGTLTNGRTPDENVYLTRVTLSGAGTASVGSLDISYNGLAYAYGTNDMSSDAGGMLYLYLPATASTTAAQAANGAQTRTYTGEIVTSGDHSAQGILYAAFHNTSGDDSGYLSRILIDSATDISVSGRIHRCAALMVKDMALHPEGTCAACDAIRKAQNDNQLILAFDIDLTQGFSGPITVSIPVDNRYDGQMVAILHCVNGRLETLAATVVNGKATFTVTELSPFAVTTGLLVPDSAVADPPKTGDNGFNLAGSLMCGVSAAGLAVLTILGKRKRTYKG